MNRVWWVTIPLLIFSCSANFSSKESYKDFCSTYIGKTVKVKATYLGWKCPKNCGLPPITRSDVCWTINNFCIYSLPVENLNPINDINKSYLLEVKVLKNKKGICYLKVLSISALMNTKR